MSIQSSSLVPAHRIHPHERVDNLLEPPGLRVATAKIGNGFLADAPLVERMWPVMREELVQLRSFVTEVGLEVAVSLSVSGEIYVVGPPQKHSAGIDRTRRLHASLRCPVRAAAARD